MGCNDLSSAEYISKVRHGHHPSPIRCPHTPVFPNLQQHPCLLQTRSNTQRALMQPDEILRLSPESASPCSTTKPALLCKLAPEELPGYGELKPCKVIRYVPAWAKREKRNKARGEGCGPRRQSGDGRRRCWTRVARADAKSRRRNAARRKPVPPPIGPVDPGLIRIYPAGSRKASRRRLEWRRRP